MRTQAVHPHGCRCLDVLQGFAKVLHGQRWQRLRLNSRAYVTKEFLKCCKLDAGPVARHARGGPNLLPFATLVVKNVSRMQ
eukprot:9500389-Pyramimonas_sp.AAC.1